jgi:hypothetical protein
LVQVNANTLAVKDVFGNAAGGIYTAGGLNENNCLAVYVDQTESFAAAGSDRIWVLHRNGLSFADMVVSTGAVGTWTKVVDTVTGAGPNQIAPLTVGSTRGIANINSGALQPPWNNRYPPMLGVDHNGDVFWVSTSGTEWDTGKQRLNRLIGDGSAHVFFTIDNVAEGGALGFISMGNTSLGTGNTGSVGCFRMRLADPGDPDGSEIWLTPTHTVSAPNTTPAIFRIPTSAFNTAQDQPGAHWEIGKIWNAISANISPRLWVSPDGQAHASISNNQRYAVFESRQASLASTTLSGQIDQFDAPIGSLQVIHRDVGFGGSSWPVSIKGKRIRIPGTPGATNRGSFIVDSRTDGDTITIINPSGALEASPAAVAWDDLGAEWQETVTNDVNALLNYGAQPGWPRGDDSGLAYLWRARSGTIAASHWIWAGNRVHYQWSGSVWYRRYLPHVEAAWGRTRTATTAAVALKSGITAEFLNQAAGVNEFVTGEYYSGGVSSGLLKDPTQELTVNYDFYMEQTDLVDESGTDKTASDGPSAAFRNTEDLGTFPPATTALTFNELQLGHYQRRIRLNGSNGTTLKQATGSRNATNGFTVGVDLGSSVAVDRVMFCSSSNNATLWRDVLVDLYYSDDNITYTLADTYDSTADHPEWAMYPEAFRDGQNSPNTYANVEVEVEVDVGLIGGGAASPHRYWKLVIRSSSSVSTAHTLTGITCIRTTGAAGGFPADNKLGTADDANYLANFVQRAVWLQDSGVTNATITGGDTVTVPGGGGAPTEFENVAIDDFFRNTDNGEESKITDVSGLPTVIVTQGGLTNVAGANWEVVRNVDHRPRDDEGGSEDQAQFPSAEGEVFICPVTGYIFYHATDVTNSRTMRVEEYVKVKRAL